MERETFNRLFGEFVQHKRKIEKGWTQNDLAEKINNDFQNVSRLERGEINPSIHWVSILANGFELKLSELMKEFEYFVDAKEKMSAGIHHNNDK